MEKGSSLAIKKAGKQCGHTRETHAEIETFSKATVWTLAPAGPLNFTIASHRTNNVQIRENFASLSGRLRGVTFSTGRFVLLDPISQVTSEKLLKCFKIMHLIVYSINAGQ